ncbi:hypothetical protein KXS15_11230 [Sinorhizobium meliloti]|uniref:hypothetical protein n=1 Tax=Rhizobium meliloti TaxID=382 RepID=UPI003F18835B
MAILNFLAYNQNVNRKRNAGSPRLGSALNRFARILHPQEFKTIWIVPRQPGSVRDAKAPIVTAGKPGIVRPRMSAGPCIEAMRKNERMQLFDLLRDLLRKRSPDNTQKGRREEQ